MKNGAEVAKVKPGSCVGELALIYDEERTATVSTEETCVLWSLHRNVFQKIQGILCVRLSVRGAYAQVCVST